MHLALSTTLLLLSLAGLKANAANENKEGESQTWHRATRGQKGGPAACVEALESQLAAIDDSWLVGDGGHGRSISGKRSETAIIRSARLKMGHGNDPESKWNHVPPPDLTNMGEEPDAFPPKQNPLNHAICFNEEYNPVDLDPYEVYEAYVKMFDWGFVNKMGPPLQSVSMGNNRVTNNRLASMCLRMAFHDNSVVKNDTHPIARPNDYIDSKIECNTCWKDGEAVWLGPARNLETSGADASNLICNTERFHNNNNYDNTASRIMRMFQEHVHGKSLAQKTGWSISDLLQNCAVAAAIKMTTSSDASETEIRGLLEKFPFKTGRRDACIKKPWKKNSNAKFALCGTPDALPGVNLRADNLTGWFEKRGMKAWSFFMLMWTHTLMDNMASNCPLKRLGWVPEEGDGCLPMFPANSDAHYSFGVGDSADYFHLLCTDHAEHEVNPLAEMNTVPPSVDFEKSNCKRRRHLAKDLKRYKDWLLDEVVPGDPLLTTHFPLTIADCRLTCDQAPQYADLLSKLKGLNMEEKRELLMCSLGMLSGRGEDALTDCMSQAKYFSASYYQSKYNLTLDFNNTHMFGAYYGKDCTGSTGP